MDKSHIRLECLKLAVNRHTDKATVVDVAKTFEAYVTGEDPDKPQRGPVRPRKTERNGDNPLD